MNKKTLFRYGRYFIIFNLLIVAFIGIFNSVIRNKLLANRTNEWIVTEISGEQLYQNQFADVSFDINNIQPLDAKKAVELSMHPPQKYPVIGGIAIPDLGMNLPIFKGMIDDALYYGAGTLDPNQEMGKGNYALASHHVFGLKRDSEMLFSPLDRAENGQRIYITDKQKVYVYEIDTIQRVNPDNTDVLNIRPSGEPIITLITCTDLEATQRIIVQGKLINTLEWETSPTEQEYFARTYNQVWYW